jgi:alanyl-tRNA synthetase
VIAELPGGAEALRELGRRLTREPDLVCFLASPVDGGTQVLVARGAAAALDCGAWLKAAAARTGARGGGRAEHAEGRLPAGLDWPALVYSSS